MPYDYREYPKPLYHHKLAPTGRTFENADATKGLARKGWMDTPAKFPETRNDRPSLEGLVV